MRCFHCFEKFERKTHNQIFCSPNCRKNSKYMRQYHVRKDRADARFQCKQRQKARFHKLWEKRMFDEGKCVRCGEVNVRHPERKTCETCCSR